MGLDLELGKFKDNIKSGVIEPLMSKIKCIRYKKIININLRKKKI